MSPSPIDKVWARFSDRGDFPMLSQSVQAAVSAMDTRDFDFTALVNVILSDFALTQKVIRLANSAMYSAFGGNITTVSRALMILGIEAVGHLAVGLKLLDHFSSERSDRIEAQLELSRTMLSGHVARHVADRSRHNAREEAVVCTLMRQVGKLLVVFYLEEEWREIQQRASRLGLPEEQVCIDVLGVSFEQLGQEAATRWRLPETIRAGMRTSDEPVGSPPSHLQWLQSVTGFSTAVSTIMADPDADPALREILLSDLARAHSETLAMEQLVALTVSLAQEEAANTLLDEIGNLRSNSIAASRPLDPETTIACRARRGAVPALEPSASARADTGFGDDSRGARLRAGHRVRAPRRAQRIRSPARRGRQCRQAIALAALSRIVRTGRVSSCHRELGRHLYRAGTRGEDRRPYPVVVPQCAA